jgi:hypothetical protein
MVHRQIGIERWVAAGMDKPVMFHVIVVKQRRMLYSMRCIQICGKIICIVIF